MKTKEDDFVLTKKISLKTENQFLGLISMNRPDDMNALNWATVKQLKMVLQDMGFSDIQINALYDPQTKEAIKQIQARHGLKADGIVGPLTKIVLNSQIKSSGVPLLSKR